MLRYQMAVIVSRGFHNGAIVSRGPLIYSLAIGEKWKKLADKGQTADWEVHPTSPWNYGLVINKQDPQGSFEVELRKMGEQPFSLEGTPLALRVKGVRLKQWTLENNSAGPVPESPVAASGNTATLELVPYGAAKLRITVFPVAEK